MHSGKGTDFCPILSPHFTPYRSSNRANPANSHFREDYWIVRRCGSDMVHRGGGGVTGIWQIPNASGAGSDLIPVLVITITDIS